MNLNEKLKNYLTHEENDFFTLFKYLQLMLSLTEFLKKKKDKKSLKILSYI